MSYSSAKPLQVMVFPSGIQVITRNSENEIARLYYFTKANPNKPGKATVYFYDHTSGTPYEFDFCWDVRAKVRLSEDFVVNEYKSDGLDKILFQYYNFLVDIFVVGKDEPFQSSCLLKTSNFSRNVDQQAVIDLIGQGLPIPELRSGTAKVVVSSRRRSTHHEWLQWKSGDILAIPLNHNGKEVGCIRTRSFLDVEEAQESYFSDQAHLKVVPA